MPSLLPMKLYMFLSGMMIAAGLRRGSLKAPLVVSVLAALVYLLREESAQAAARVAMVVAVFYLMNDGSLPSCPALDGCVGKLRGLLGGRFGRFLGDTSYSVYLLHFLVIIPVSYLLTTVPGFTRLHGCVRFGACLMVSAPVVYAASWALHRYVEWPGIELGKAAVGRLAQAARPRPACP
jgi:peptidoglycan/LPS O-acetylase OafA/YrhL